MNFLFSTVKLKDVCNFVKFHFIIKMSNSIFSLKIVHSSKHRALLLVKISEQFHIEKK